MPVVRKRTVCIFLICMILSACGYRFAGGGRFPADMKSIRMAVFDNHTSEPGLETLFANDLIHELSLYSDGAIVSPGSATDAADGFITGSIESMRIETVSSTGPHGSVERRVEIAISLRLSDSNGKSVWSANRLANNETYIVMDDKLSTEQNRRDAIAEISKRIAENVYYRLTDKF